VDWGAAAPSPNTTVAPVANVVFGGSGATRTVTVTPATAGTATIIVFVTDPATNAVTTTSFTVTAVNSTSAS